MVKFIIGISDVHISNSRSLDEQDFHLTQCINKIREIVNEKNPEEVRIVIVGDIFHNKTTVSNESICIAHDFLKEISSICKTYVIAGNHDLSLCNLEKLDSISPIFKMSNFENCVYLDSELEAQSGIYEDENIAFCLYSIFNEFMIPFNMEEYKEENPDKTLIGLIHGEIIGSKMDNNISTGRGIDINDFDGTDFVFAGHIHKRQEIVKNGLKAVYCGSVFQQDKGESLTEHGGIIYNVEEKTYETFNLNRGEYGYFKFVINDFNDVMDNKEKLVNI